MTKDKILNIWRLFVLLMTALILSGVVSILVEASVKTPGKVTGLKASTKSGNYYSITLSWKKATKAKGYQIFRKTADGKGWKKLKSINSRKRKYVDKKLKSDTKYQYKVRAFTTYRSKAMSLT